MFDPATGQWNARHNLPVSGPVQLAVMNGTLYTLAPDVVKEMTRTFAYNQAEDRWTRLRNAPVLLFGAAVVAIDRGLYAIGGYARATDTPYARTTSHAAYVLRRAGAGGVSIR